MPKIGPIHAPSTFNGTIVDGEDRSITLPKRDDLGPRLHARALLRYYELAPCEVNFGLRQQDRDL